ncbi:mercuric transport protein MerTP [Dawidia soli]|uniref:Mercuric transport protein MerT n=1 Tax=Dawidia soli TaxID=2782352 RepID=A0AAP2GEY9_9BACT|nr:mercuric transport protein MerTP [Dawidia soli]MBT1688849.1 mercuric transport protein MerTP [Dawidia soli]
MKASVVLTVLTSASASLCCIVPFLGIIGSSGSLMTTVSWLEPFRPFFIGGTLLFLGIAWFQVIRASKTDACGCEEKRSFFQSKKFLGIITAVSLLLLAFPSYSGIFKSEQSFASTQDKSKKVVLSVSGMTCASCEHHIESEVKKLAGVSAVKASYADKSAIVEYDPIKVDESKIIATINNTGYKVEQNGITGLTKADRCTKGSCTPETCNAMPKVNVPTEKSKNLKVLARIDDLKVAFNKMPGKVKFVAILSSSCGWCLQGAQAIQQSVSEKMGEKGISVLIVWTNMLKSDDQDRAFKAASMFTDPAIIQYFDAENKFGDLVARRLNPKGEKAWDIYMFFEGDDQWTSSFPRPFEYAHQLSETLNPWADQTKYFCGKDLTKRLNDITTSL